MTSVLQVLVHKNTQSAFLSLVGFPSFVVHLKKKTTVLSQSVVHAALGVLPVVVFDQLVLLR